MNFLAHAYLSFGDPQILLGNMISDFVKGKKKFDYPERVLKGINLHRSIDSFTDEHPVNRAAARIFRPAYGLYGAAFLDVIYDHFLAAELAADGHAGFKKYTEAIYRQLSDLEWLMPPGFVAIFPYMKAGDWLYNYQFAWGIENSFRGLVHRAKYMTDSETAFQIFNGHYGKLREAYAEFFPQLRQFSLEKFPDIH